MTSERILRLTIEYDGTRYRGWQLQPEGPTIQGEIERALEVILGRAHRVHGAGRTDAGVHARAQVAHVRIDHPMPERRLHRALNGVLPKDIAVIGVERAPVGFHSRFSPHVKTYTYTIVNRPYRSVFWRERAWFIPSPLDWTAMARGLRSFEGEHDFRAFRASNCQARTTIRTIEGSALDEVESGVFRFMIQGRGFLKQMVRTMIGTLVEIGKGRMTVEGVEALLAGAERREAGPTAPARGLCLESITYLDENPG